MLEIKLRELLSRENMTIAELSEKTKTNRASLTQLANNNSKMVKFETLDKIVNALNVNDVSDLFKLTNAGKVQLILKSKKSSTHFVATMKIVFEPVRGERIEEKFDIDYVLSKLDSDTYVLNGQPLQNITQDIENVFHWASDKSLALFIQEFWKELLNPPSKYEPVLQPDFLKHLSKDEEHPKHIQVFSVVRELPWLTKVIDVYAVKNIVVTKLFPEGFQVSEGYSNTPKNEIVFIPDLYGIFENI
ncbi:helix-turn-helix transcriptional regulator [Lactiplantibacillus xiangfangensis]|nr:helix-turn-helix transcriptional regulator [Lactiplantibacillus xiangfangensis]